MIEAVGSGNDFRLPISGGEGVAPSSPPSSQSVPTQSPVTLVAGVGSAAIVARKNEKGDGVGKESESDSTDALSNEELKEMIDRINEKLNGLNREVQFKMDDKVDVRYISVVDTKTEKVIREFPPEEIRSLMGRLREFSDSMNGGEETNLLVNMKV